MSEKEKTYSFDVLKLAEEITSKFPEGVDQNFLETHMTGLMIWAGQVASLTDAESDDSRFVLQEGNEEAQITNEVRNIPPDDYLRVLADPESSVRRFYQIPEAPQEFGGFRSFLICQRLLVDADVQEWFKSPHAGDDLRKILESSIAFDLTRLTLDNNRFKRKNENGENIVDDPYNIFIQKHGERIMKLFQGIQVKLFQQAIPSPNHPHASF